MALFGKPKYTIVRLRKKEIPKGLWTKCQNCQGMIYNKDLEDNLMVCPKCNYHYTIGARERIRYTADDGTFLEQDTDMESKDPLDFKGPKTYQEKLKADQTLTGLKEAAIWGLCKIENTETVLAVTDSRFIMGSMGSVVGEKITRAVEKGIDKRLSVVIISGSGGGARMHEGMFSLMQMAKTSTAIAKHSEAGLFFISVLTNPTMAGVLASFASLGDIIIAEPKALIGFTGPRVIEQTIHQILPEGFQRSEFLLEHGLIDMIAERKDLKHTIGRILKYQTLT
ncbi:acetyl-CoA carboxylase carboxyl transferase subunit beta [bacterium Unc6]|nr:acetyl-CoA carboxylase carboxyl transferase subunit beta [bacterium Unc6]